MCVCVCVCVCAHACACVLPAAVVSLTCVVLFTAQMEPSLMERNWVRHACLCMFALNFDLTLCCPQERTKHES